MSDHRRLWLRRAAILSQLDHKRSTDVGLLAGNERDLSGLSRREALKHLGPPACRWPRRTVLGRRRTYADAVTEYQVTYWRDLPSLVVAREGEHQTKSPLAPRFQEAIDEAAMRLGDTGSDAYLAGWRRGEWTSDEGSVTEVADRAVAALEKQWPEAQVEAYLDSLATDPATDPATEPAIEPATKEDA